VTGTRGEPTGRLEAERPPVTSWRDLPEPQADLARRGFEAWQAGRLDEANNALTLLREAAEVGQGRDALFHALHLLACVAFSESNYATSRELHTQVLVMCEAIDFLGGQASSLFDLAMIDQVEGDIVSARLRYEAARAAFASGGYEDRLGVVDTALAALDT
jgi:hypothetical protein